MAPKANRDRIARLQIFAELILINTQRPIEVHVESRKEESGTLESTLTSNLGGKDVRYSWSPLVLVPLDN